MSEPRNTEEILAEAERAASTGDFLAAETLLRDAALRQEAELGPVHPDLANTVNNLAVAAEKSGRLDDAETFYRRAVGIAQASLHPDDPKLAASRQNLEDFCRAHGRPMNRPQTIELPAEAPALAIPAPTPALAVPTPAAALAIPTPAPAHGIPAPLPTLAIPTPAPPLPLPRVPPKASRTPANLPIGAVGLIVFATVMAWLLAPRHPSTISPAADRSPAKAVEPAPLARTVAPASRKLAPPPAPSRTAAPTSGAVRLVTVQLCRGFSRDTFRCTPAEDSVPAGTIVLYTRVRSPKDGVIVHSWYQGDALRKTARLKVGANEAEGYRTYSQQTVDRGDWRVEVRSPTGDLLYEHRLTVR